MTNYLLSMCFDSGNGQYETYKKMQELSLKSFTKNLLGDWSFILLDGVIQPANMFKSVFWMEQGLARSGNSNILVTGADTLCVKPTAIFGEYSNFMMFGPADCDSPILSPEIQRYMCGVYYYPQNVDVKVLDLGASLAHKWDDSVWDYCQWVYNKMYYAQVLKNPAVDARFSYQLPKARDYVNNGIQISEARIVHFHATRGAEYVLRAMQSYGI